MQVAVAVQHSKVARLVLVVQAVAVQPLLLGQIILQHLALQTEAVAAVVLAIKPITQTQQTADQELS
jgi:hypothetical protein